MKRVFEACADGAFLQILGELINPYSHNVKKGDQLILDDNKIDGWKLLPRNSEIKKR